ncbi:hypothetical protein [Sphingopyxis sp.]|uniref:hypothetical protein n=1 Tax=Sphingopyxis sp. TaxID=1908224 RepID=UPI003D10B67B
MVFLKQVGVSAFTLLLAACSSPTPPSQDETEKRAEMASTVAGEQITADKTRTITLNTQGVAPIGLTVRLKGIELGTDATVLQVSASYGGTETNNVPLASEATYLRDEHGNKLMLKPPQDNPRLDIIRGEQLDGQLVFLGSVPPDTKQLTLVINDNNPGDSTLAPGLAIPFSLESAEP